MSSPRLHVPPAKPAPTDLYCWLSAAYPATPTGHLPTSRIATDLDVSTRTLRRWITDQGDSMSHLTPTQRARLSRRAILRGQGTYFWPLVDDDVAWRIDRALDQAQHNLLTLNHPARVPTSWHDRGYLRPHTVLLLHYPRAHVHGIAIASHHKHQARLYRNAEILDEQPTLNRWDALTTKYATLQTHRDRQCTAPQGLVPTGHTETLRETISTPPSLIH